MKRPDTGLYPAFRDERGSGLEGDQTTQLDDHVLRLGQDKILRVGLVGDRGVDRGHAAHRCIQPFEEVVGRPGELGRLRRRGGV